MDFAVVLVMIATLMALAYVLWPFLVSSEVRAGRANGGSLDVLRDRADLLAERNRVYAAIRALDFDHSTNKIADDDYTAERHQLVAMGVELLKHIDGLMPLDESPADDPIEATVIALRRGGVALAAAPGRARRLKGKGHKKASGRVSFCPRCGKPTVPADRFCGSCGVQI
jgi:hypothetical protein